MGIFEIIMVIAILIIFLVLLNLYIMIKNLKKSMKYGESNIRDLNYATNKTRDELDYIYLKSKILPLDIKKKLNKHLGTEDYIVNTIKSIQKNEVETPILDL